MVIEHQDAVLVHSTLATQGGQRDTAHLVLTHVHGVYQFGDVGQLCRHDCS